MNTHANVRQPSPSEPAADRRRIDELNGQGYTLIEGVLSPETAAAMSRRLEALHAAKRDAGAGNYPGFDPAQEKIVFNLHNKDDLFLGLIDHPAVMPLLNWGLEETLVLNYFNGRSPVQGSRLQRLHVDSRIPFPANVVMMQVIWMLDDFTIENGATRVIPGSHKLGRKPDPAASYPEELQITGKAGSLFVYNSSLWHGAGACRVAAPRWSVIATYSRWFIKPSMDFTKNTPPELFARLSRAQKQLLGFNSVPPHDETVRTATLTPIDSLPASLADFKG